MTTTRFAFIASVLILASSGSACATYVGVGRTYVEHTDNLWRASRERFAPVAQLLNVPPAPTLVRDIGVVGGEQPIDFDDAHLWVMLSERANRLGANAIQLMHRDIAPCINLANVGAMCVSMRMRVLITEPAVDCATAQVCRTQRTDAYTVPLATK